MIPRWDVGPGWPTGVLLAGDAAVLTLIYGPLARRAVTWAERHDRVAGRPAAARRLAEPAVQCAAHLLALGLLGCAALAAGRAGRILLGQVGAAVTRDGGQPLVILAAAAVGTAEVGLAALAASVLLATAPAPLRAWPRAVPRPAWAARRPAMAGPGSVWLTLPRSGWVRRWPRPGGGSWAAVTAWALLVAGVAAEEAVFRGVMVTALRPFGGWVAIGLPTLAYLAYGLGRPAARRSRAEAACCCGVLGVVNGALFLAIPSLPPLIVTHLTFLLVLG